MADGVALEPGSARTSYEPGRAMARLALGMVLPETTADGQASTRGGQALGDPGMSASSPQPGSLGPGSHVEVRNRFTGSWSRGFEVAGIVDGGYEIRRLSDGNVLPTAFPPEDVRPRPAKKAGLWWYR